LAGRKVEHDRSRAHDGFPSKLSRVRPAFSSGSHVTMLLPERSKATASNHKRSFAPAGNNQPRTAPIK